MLIRNSLKKLFRFDLEYLINCIIITYGLMTENGLLPIGNIADISYHVEIFKLRLLRDVCAL